MRTGTPAGVGIGFTPPRYLRPGDEVAITAPRLGTLVNRVASGTATGPAPSPASTATAPAGLRRVAGKDLFVEVAGEGPAVVFVHGLGGTTTFHQVPAQALAEDHTVVRFDLSGHGRSPLYGTPAIAGWADDLEALLDALGLESAAVVGHSMGTLIAAHFAATRPERTTRLALIGPVREQPAAAKQATRERARTVREGGMPAVADTIVGAATSEETRRTRPLAAALVRELLLAQPPEGYARACEALAAAPTPDFGSITAPALLLAGSDDKVSPPAVSEEIAGALGEARVTVLNGVGHWHAVEAPGAVTDALRACCMEIAVSSCVLLPGASHVVDGVAEMRKKVREVIGLGVDNIKLITDGEAITGTLQADLAYMSYDEIAVAVAEAHALGVRVNVYARSAESVKRSVRAGVDNIYHASFVDEEGLDLLEAARDRVFVAPGINWLIATLNDAAPWGYTPSRAEADGYKRELEIAVEGLKEMHRRGIPVLPGGDYGFAWTPHGTYARDLEHFTTLLDFTPMEALLSATAMGGRIMGRPDELGQVRPGYLADLILVDGDPLLDIRILQDRSRLTAIMKGGAFHKEPPREPSGVPVAAAAAAPQPLVSAG